MERYGDATVFREHILPVVENDLLRNTVFLSELSSIDAGTKGTYLGSVSCSACPSRRTSAAVAAGPRGVITSSVFCDNTVKALARQLDALDSVFITAPSAAAKHIMAACQWDLKHTMNLMELKESSSTTTPAPNTNASTAAVPGDVVSPTSAAAESNASSITSRPLPKVHLRVLSPDSSEDMSLILDWSSDFFQDQMLLPSKTSTSQVQAMILPWVLHGQYSLALASGTAAAAAAAATAGDQQPAAPVSTDVVQQHPLTLLCHVPTSSSSTRIVQVFTPHQFRRKGYARAAGEQETRI